MGKESKEKMFKALFISALVTAILIILPVIICIYLQLFLPTFCKDNGIDISNIITPVSYVLSVVSLGLGAWSIYQASRSNKESQKLMDSVRSIETKQEMITKYVIQTFHEGKGPSGSWNGPDNIND